VEKHVTWLADGRNVDHSRLLKGKQARAECNTELEGDGGIPVRQGVGALLRCDLGEVAGCFGEGAGFRDEAVLGCHCGYLEEICGLVIERHWKRVFRQCMLNTYAICVGRKKFHSRLLELLHWVRSRRESRCTILNIFCGMDVTSKITYDNRKDLSTSNASHGMQSKLFMKVVLFRH
jgi:hypothetical protein